MGIRVNEVITVGWGHYLPFDLVQLGDGVNPLSRVSTVLVGYRYWVDLITCDGGFRGTRGAC